MKKQITLSELSDELAQRKTKKKETKKQENLNNEEKTKAILNSDAAKALFKKFFGGSGNG